MLDLLKRQAEREAFLLGRKVATLEGKELEATKARLEALAHVWLGQGGKLEDWPLGAVAAELELVVKESTGDQAGQDDTTVDDQAGQDDITVDDQAGQDDTTVDDQAETKKPKRKGK